MKETTLHPWHAFRLWVAGRLMESQSPFMRELARTCRDLDYEGPPICGGIYQSLHAMWEEGADYAKQEGVSELEWWEGDSSMLQDWVMNAHPGMCPDHISYEAMRVFS